MLKRSLTKRGRRAIGVGVGLSLLAFGAPLAGTASAAHIGCGATITVSTTLHSDIGPCPGNGLIIGADKITLDLGGHRIFGTPGPGDGLAGGVRLPQRSGVTIQNGTISDFDAGVAIYGGSGNTVRNLAVRDNVGPDDTLNAELGDGIYLYASAKNLITGNTVVGNGVYDGIGVWGKGADANTILNNVVEATVGTSDRTDGGVGIITNGADLNSTVIHNTLIRGNVVRSNSGAGISNVNHVGGTIENNTIEGNGFRSGNGNGIGVQMGRAAPGGSSLVIRNNEVHGNYQHGIVILDGAHGNKITNNNAADNAVVRLRGAGGVYDLMDENPACGTEDGRNRRLAPNFWSGNTWGTGGYNPPCTANDGNGPAYVPMNDGPDTTSQQQPTVRRAPSS